jgi:hypothetical protein
MPTAAPWPVWSKFLMGALILYSGLLCAVSLSVFIDALRNGWALKADDIEIQTLMALFLPLLLVGLRRQRLASGLLFLATGIDLLLILTVNRSTGDGTAAMLAGSVVFLGIPLLSSAIFLHTLVRRGAG